MGQFLIYHFIQITAPSIHYPFSPGRHINWRCFIRKWQPENVVTDVSTRKKRRCVQVFFYTEGDRAHNSQSAGIRYLSQETKAKRYWTASAGRKCCRCISLRVDPDRPTLAERFTVPDCFCIKPRVKTAPKHVYLIIESSSTRALKQTWTY